MTTARQKLEGLTHSWMGLVMFSAIWSVVENGFGLFSMIFTGIWTVFMLGLVYFLGSRLQKKSDLTRILLIVVSGLGTVLGGYAVAKTGWMAISNFSFMLLLRAVFGAGAVALYVRSFRTLTDSQVKAHFN